MPSEEGERFFSKGDRSSQLILNGTPVAEGRETIVVNCGEVVGIERGAVEVAPPMGNSDKEQLHPNDRKRISIKRRKRLCIMAFLVSEFFLRHL
jgi:hypothetical protein